MHKRIAILGSTGSIGTQALDIIAREPDHFHPTVLTAHNNAELLIKQALEFNPAVVVIANEEKYTEVKTALAQTEIAVLAGLEALEEVVERDDVDVVLTALVGFVGLKPTIKAIKAKKDIALANKETLVVAGHLIMPMAKEYGVKILPVDSEHSAIFQCLTGEEQNPIEKIYLTASGGPFRGYTKGQLGEVTVAQALKHPNWEMGAKITIDSASMMNKGLEVIEARWLFDLRVDQIDVIVHPQSILHSIVQFEDSSMKAQMGLPDMRVPIEYALSYPGRTALDIPRFNFIDYPNLTFEQIDTDVFQNLALAYEALARGGDAACILNAANEVTNKRFREGKISFLQIAELNAGAMRNLPHHASPLLQDLLDADQAARDWVDQHI
ncbi:MAG: 1-deoxy-D-xylulose-5-phosphate reductoisomerase [Bacteroidia bacterium]